MSQTFHTELYRIWESAVDQYKQGGSSPSTIVQEKDLTLLSGWGLNRMDVFDFVEDWCLHQEPDFSTFLLVHYERWRFFVEKQKSIPSSNLLDPKTLPPKDQRARGIAWLPRILPKAQAKLRGELPPEVMYGCGGDREFFKSNHIHPAEFLSIVDFFGHDDELIIEWVLKRKSSLARDH
jgi:hypothetical protein